MANIKMQYMKQNSECNPADFMGVPCSSEVPFMWILPKAWCHRYSQLQLGETTASPY